MSHDESLCTTNRCIKFAPGHIVHWIQMRLVSESPDQWRDAVVTDVGDDGFISGTFLDDDTTWQIWHHHSLTKVLRPNEPVQLHGRFHVLSAAGRVYCVKKIFGVPHDIEPKSGASTAPSVIVTDISAGTGVREVYRGPDLS